MGLAVPVAQVELESGPVALAAQEELVKLVALAEPVALARPAELAAQSKPVVRAVAAPIR